jgi:hypothetical protein
LVERKINLLLAPSPAAPNKTCMESPVSTLDSPFFTPHTLEKKIPPPTYNLPTLNPNLKRKKSKAP